MPGMKLCAEELADRLDLVSTDEVVDIWRILGKMTLDVVGATVFGVKFKALQDAGQGKAAKATEIFFASAAFGALKNPYNLALLFLPAIFHPLLIACQRAFPHQMDKDMKWAVSVAIPLSPFPFPLSPFSFLLSFYHGLFPLFLPLIELEGSR